MFPFQGVGQKLVAELGLKAMNLTGYSAMNIGWNELSVGSDVLNGMISGISFPLVTSNLVHKNSRLPLGKKYVISHVGDIRVGILGIMPVSPPASLCSTGGGGCGNHNAAGHDHSQEEISPALLMENMEVIPPEDALQKLLPEVRKEADIVILLSQYSFEDTTSLVNQLEGIDLAVSGSRKRWARTNNKDSRGVPVMEVAYQTRKLGYLKVSLDDTGRVIQDKQKMIRLGDTVASDVQIAQITGNDIHKKIQEEEKRKLEEEARALLKLSPYEYYQKLMKEQQDMQGSVPPK
ncbi:hypothetical protein QUF80_23095 [Desulfococcaceae bacterium HSG8]|nr:hypothetical protein [Desulfococcaceae bacterium HSG8]